MTVIQPEDPPTPRRSSAPRMVAPSTRVNIAFPFSTMRVEEATQELAELTAVVVDLLGLLENLLPDNADALEALRVRAEGVAGRLR